MNFKELFKVSKKISKKEKNLKKGLNAFFVLVVMVILFSLLTVFFIHIRDHYEDETQKLIDDSKFFEATLNYVYSEIARVSSYVAGNETLIDAVYNNDINVINFYKNRLSDLFPLTRIIFVDNKGIILYRFNDLEKTQYSALEGTYEEIARAVFRTEKPFSDFTICKQNPEDILIASASPFFDKNGELKGIVIASKIVYDFFEKLQIDVNFIHLSSNFFGVRYSIAKSDLNGTKIEKDNVEKSLKEGPFFHTFRYNKHLYLAYLKPFYSQSGRPLFLIESTNNLSIVFRLIFYLLLLFFFTLFVLLTSLYFLKNFINRNVLKPLDTLQLSFSGFEKGEKSMLTTNNLETSDFFNIFKGFNKMKDSIVKREEELKIALLDAEASLRQRNLFLSTMTHELKSPLTSIISFSDVLLQKKEIGPLSSYVDNIKKNSQILISRIDNVLALARIEAKGIEPNYTEIKTLEFFDEILMLLSNEINEKEIKINKSIEDISIKADRWLLTNILFNIISNAIKYSRVNGVIDIIIKKEEEKVFFSVRDYGEGISDENKSYVFEPFSKLAFKNHKYKEGTGIGLFLAKLYIEAMKGKIGFESKLGSGSNFFFYIPED